MNKKTYLQESLKSGRIMRWTCKMPLKVFIAPMQFYSKRGQDSRYRSMVRKALDSWQAATKGKVSFAVIDDLYSSQINVSWKRVERKALGCCYFQFDKQQRLYSAEVNIGLTDGLIHRDYMDDGEVYHTILHEIGHALGLGHSPFPQDIMYTPHQKGVLTISSCDVLTLNWLYTLPQGATINDVASRYGVNSSNNVDEVIAYAIDKKLGKLKSEDKTGESSKPAIKRPKRDLLEEQDSIANLRKYHMSLQNVKLSEDVRKFLHKPPSNQQ